MKPALDPRTYAPHFDDRYFKLAEEVRDGRYTIDKLKRQLEIVGIDGELFAQSDTGQYILFSKNPESEDSKSGYSDNLVFELVDGVLNLTEGCDEYIFGPTKRAEIKELKERLEILEIKVRKFYAEN